MGRPLVLLALVVGVAFTVSRCDPARRRGPPHHRHGPPRREIGGPLVEPGVLPAWPSDHRRRLGVSGDARVTVEVSNDCPTLTGAQTSFSARLRVPRELEAAWRGAEPGRADRHPDCGSGRHPGAYGGGRGDPPRGDLPRGDSGRKGPRFVYVWSGLGRSWQVSGNATSGLVLESRGVPLGSHPMGLVVYRRGGDRQFVPVARATSQFTVTDQVPFSVELSQSGEAAADSGEDVEAAEERDGGMEVDGSPPGPPGQRFVAGPNVRFEARLHDPSGYLRGADVSYSWDFGDGSGLLISRLAYALHSFAGPGAYAARLAVQATVPAPCATTSAAGVTTTTTAVTTAAAVVSATTTTTATTTAAAATTTTTAAVKTTATTTTTTTAALGNISATTRGANVSTTESASAAGPEGRGDTTARAATEPYGTTVSWDLWGGDPTAGSVNGTSSGPSRAPDAAGSSQENPALSLLLLSRAVSGQERPTDCPIYRYGTYSTTVEVVDGIAAAQVRRAVSVPNGGALFSAPRALLDFEVETRGGSPSRVCSELLSADCGDALGEPACEAVPPGRCGDGGPVCSLVLRREFRATGSYCVRVTVTDARSSASATARLSLHNVSESASLEAAIIIGALAVVVVIGLAVFMHRRPRRDLSASRGGGACSGSRAPRWWCRCRGFGATVRDLLATQDDPKHVLLINA